MNGQISVESKQGEGTTFILNIVFDTTHSNDNNYFENKDLNNLTSLIIDDNKNNRLVFTKYLSYWGIDCDEAQSVDEAIARIKSEHKKQNHYDLIFVDYHMPEKNGIDFAKAMKKENLMGKSQMIMLSSISEMISEQKLQDYGFKVRIFKPIKMDQFKEAILKALNKEIDEKVKFNKEEVKDINLPPANIKILLAEDNLINQKVAMISLQQLGYKLDIAQNGVEAVEMYKKHHYDLILMDIQMPELNGMDATIAIKEYEKTTKTEKQAFIVALTASAMKDDVEKYHVLGMNEVLTKPFHQKDLKEILIKAYKTIGL